MKDFKTIFSFYFYKQIKSKGFWIITTLLCLLSIGSMIFMHLYFKEPEKTVLYIVDQTESLDTVWENELLAKGEVGNVKLDFGMLDSAQTIDELKEEASDKEKSFALFGENSGTYTLSVIDESNVSYTDISLLQSVITQIIQGNNVAELQISDDVLSKINPEIIVEILDPSEESNNLFVILILFMVMVMFAILYSTSSSGEVSYLKTNRVMEIFSTSVKPVPLYLGVNFATSIIPFIQVVLAGTCLFVTKMILKVDFSNMSAELGIDLNQIEPLTLVIYIIFFLLGFYVYSFIITAVVSIISKAEDVATVSVPVAFIGLIQYFVGITIMEKDNMVAAVASYFPLTPSVMFMRYGLGYVGIIPTLISIAILVITVVLLAYYGARIFRNGVSYYGNLKEFKIKDKNN